MDELERLRLELKSRDEDIIRLLQQVAHLNNELDDYFMDREILTHMVDDTTELDD